MNKRTLLATIITFLLLTGCGKTSSLTKQQSKEQTTSEATTTTTVATTSSGAIDYSQYVKKTWTLKMDNGEVHFNFYQIENGKIAGKYMVFPGRTGAQIGFYIEFEGKINKDMVECQFNDQFGNKGELKLIFKANNVIEATVTFEKRSKATVQPPVGTFEYKPLNIKELDGFVPFENQSFSVNLDSWGNVNFVSGKIVLGKLTENSKIPLEFYLTNKDGDIIYQFDGQQLRNEDVKAVLFEDLNKDGLKDLIIITEDVVLGPRVTIYLQEKNGLFTNDTNLVLEIRDSGINLDVESIRRYLSKKY